MKYTKEPTCLEPGKAEYACSCGKTMTKEVPETGHAWGEWKVTTPAEVGVPGEETRICANDASHIETRPIEALKPVTYTVTYTDGLAPDEEAAFEDQVCNNLKSGEYTPAFEGTPTREGYEFKGWSPEVEATVTASVIYTAQWEKKVVEPEMVTKTLALVKIFKGLESADQIPEDFYMTYQMRSPSVGSGELHKKDATVTTVGGYPALKWYDMGGAEVQVPYGEDAYFDVQEYNYEVEGFEYQASSDFKNGHAEGYINWLGSDKNIAWGLTKNLYNKYAPKTVEPETVEQEWTIIKGFNGITKEQIPDNFYMTYEAQNGHLRGGVNQTGTLTKADAEFTTTTSNSGESPALKWTVTVTVPADRTSITTTFTEYNYTVDGYVWESSMFVANEDRTSASADKRISKVVAATSWIYNDYKIPYTYKLIYHANNDAGQKKTVSYGKATYDSLVAALLGIDGRIKGDTNDYRFFEFTAPKGANGEDAEFLGWQLEGDTSGKLYQAGETVTLTAPDKCEVHLYAVWEEESKPTPGPVEPDPEPEKVTITVIIKDEDGTVLKTGTVEVVKGSEYNVSDKTVAPEGYEIVSTEGDMKGTADADKTITVTVKKTENVPDDKPEPPHVHSYSTVVTNPTCTTEGVTIYTCACGHTYTETVPALGHVFGNWTTILSATCTEDGYQTRLCARCDASESRTIPAFGHAYGEWQVSKPAEVGVEGEEIRICAHDASHILTRPIAALPVPEPEPEEDIEPDPTPLAPEPDEDIEPDPTPLAPGPVDQAPKTGDDSFLAWSALSVSLLGLVVLALTKKRGKQE